MPFFHDANEEIRDLNRYEKNVVYLTIFGAFFASFDFTIYFYFNDSTRVNNQKIYNLSFSPKNKFAPLFTGRFSIDSASMGIIYIETYFRKEANVNFVSGFKGSVSYTKQEDGGVFLAKQEININLAISLKKDTSQYASKRVDNVSNGNWVLNKTTYYSTDKTLNTIKASEWKNQEEFKLKKFNADDDQKIKKTKADADCF